MLISDENATHCVRDVAYKVLLNRLQINPSCTQVTVTECNVSPGCMSNESALSAITRAKIKYTLDDTKTVQDLSLIVKELPKDPFSRFFVIEGQFDLREIKFYTQVSNRLIYATMLLLYQC